MSQHSPLRVVLNPNARGPRVKPPSLDELKQQLGPQSLIHVTPNLAELDRLMHECSNREETLCFFGGDGSIGRGLTSLIHHRGTEKCLPPVMAVPAGTINMLCNVLGLQGSVDETLSEWKSGELSTIREIPLMKIEVGDLPPRYGFVFVWGLGFRVLRRYYARSPHPSVWDGLVAFSQTMWDAVQPRADEKPLFRALDIGLALNGGAPTNLPLQSLTVGTIPRLSLGMRPFVPDAVNTGGFHATGHGLKIHQVVRHLPTIVFGLGDLRKLKCQEKLVVGAGVSRLECRLSEGFTLDGEMFELQEPTIVRITPGPVVRFWARKA